MSPFLLLLFALLWMAWIWNTYRVKNLKLFRILIAVSLVLLILITATIGVMIKNYPTQWRDINLSEKRVEIHKKLGTPTVGSWDIKGDIWIENHFFCWHRLELFYNHDTIARDYYIEFYIGTQEYFKSYNVASSFDERSSQK